jgi:hypothetical protein
MPPRSPVSHAGRCWRRIDGPRDPAALARSGLPAYRRDALAAKREGNGWTAASFRAETPMRGQFVWSIGSASPQWLTVVDAQRLGARRRSIAGFPTPTWRGCGPPNHPRMSCGDDRPRRISTPTTAAADEDKSRHLPARQVADRRLVRTAETDTTAARTGSPAPGAVVARYCTTALSGQS